MNQINIHSERLNRIMELAKELKISPFAEKLNTMVLSGELELTSKSVEEIILELLETTSKEREESQLAKNISRLGLHNPTANLNNILWNIGRKGISKRELSELSTCDWIRCRRNLILLGATGVGKTRIADTLAITALQSHLKVFYRRASLFVSELRELEGNEEIKTYLKMLSKHDLIYIDDFASGHLDPLGESMLCEIADEISDKHKASLLITTQHDVESWLRNYFYSAANGEAFVDRVFTPAIKFDLDGPTLRVNIFQSENNGTPVINGTAIKKNETGATIGKSENDSSILVPKRKRGRPRKNPVTDCNNRKISEIKEFETNVHAGTGTDDGTRGTEAKEQTAALNEEMKKMNNQEYHLTPLLKELVETVRNIAAEGQDVNFKNLSERNPHHARRDYFKALEIYKDEQTQLSNCKYPMPVQIRNRCEALFQQSWAIISNYFDEQLRKEKQNMDESVKEARSARDSAFDDNDILKEINEKLKAQILKLQQELDESHKANEKLESYKRDLEFANKELQCKNEQQEKTIAILKEMIDKLKS